MKKLAVLLMVLSLYCVHADGDSSSLSFNVFVPTVNLIAPLQNTLEFENIQAPVAGQTSTYILDQADVLSLTTNDPTFKNILVNMQVMVDGVAIESPQVALSIKAIEEEAVAQVDNFSPRFAAFGPQITTSQPNYLFDATNFKTVVYKDLDLVYELTVQNGAPEGDYTIQLSYDLVDANVLIGSTF